MPLHDVSAAPHLGQIALVYRYTVTGSVKASVDTGVDAPQAGSNDFTNGDLLEIFIHGRTDQAAPISDCLVRFNNDSGSNYVHAKIRESSGVSGSDTGTGATSIDLYFSGDTNTANSFSAYQLWLPNYLTTAAWKGYTALGGVGTSASGQSDLDIYNGTYKSTTPITRVAFIAGASFNFKIGSTFLIYKRLAA